MKEISAEEYKKQQIRSWIWANSLLRAQETDPRPEVVYRDHRPIIDLKQMLESSHSNYKDEIAFYTKFKKGPYETITYDEFYNDVNALGTALINAGLKEKRVAVIGETNYSWSVSYLAVVAGTGVVVPLDKELPYSNLKNLVIEAEVSAVIADKARLPLFKKMLEEGDTPLQLVISQSYKEDDAELPSLHSLIAEGKELIASGDRRFLDAQIDPEEMSVLIFTSGTMGLAKGIMLSHKNICADLMATPTFICGFPGDIFFSLLPIHHTFECTANFLMPIYTGCAVAHCEGLKYIVKNLQEVRPTAIMVVPAVLEALHRAIWKNIKKQGKEESVRRALKISDTAGKFKINLRGVLFSQIRNILGGRLRAVICGGAAINPQILDDFNAFGMCTIQGYGLSECSPIAALNPECAPHSESCGMVLPGFEVRIDSPGPDGNGEICLKGDNVMIGYYKNPEATAEAIRDGWYYTGDVGHIDKDGYIILTGRKKNVIITKNGKNVFPEELEYMLSCYDEIADSMVFAGESETKDDDVIIAAIYPDWTEVREKLGDAADDDAEVDKLIWNIVGEVNKNNPGYKMIKRINIRHKDFERNSSKKIKRFVPENKEAN